MDGALVGGCRFTLASGLLLRPFHTHCFHIPNFVSGIKMRSKLLQFHKIIRPLYPDFQIFFVISVVGDGKSCNELQWIHISYMKAAWHQSCLQKLQPISEKRLLQKNPRSAKQLPRRSPSRLKWFFSQKAGCELGGSSHRKLVVNWAQSNW